jgi:hypothetical protein
MQFSHSGFFYEGALPTVQAPEASAPQPRAYVRGLAGQER